MSVATAYRQRVASGELLADPVQAALVERLQRLSDELLRRRRWTPPRRSLFARWREPNLDPAPGARGLYLWGGVGRGKTLLADLFFDALPFDDRERLHFHHFMAGIHAQLRALGHIDNPLQRIADERAQRARLLLLDEIHVNDITDAMLLGGLLTALFERGVTLVTTSNVPPQGLYRNGLQRARFLPAIAQIVRHCEVIEIEAGEDYRQRVLGESRLWLDEDETADRARLDALFTALAGQVEVSDEPLQVGGRAMPVIACAGGVVRLSFETLFAQPRSTGDYIELARRFHTVFVDGIPLLDRTRDDEARRFVNLVDEFYDRGTRLVASAAASPDALYTGDRLAFEFERAASRLTEMQAADWQRTVRGEDGHANIG